MKNDLVKKQVTTNGKYKTFRSVSYHKQMQPMSIALFSTCDSTNKIEVIQYFFK